MTPVNNSLPFRLGVGAALKAVASAYSQTVRNEPGLLAYWRVGDTQDADASRERSYVALGIVPHLDEDPLGDASTDAALSRYTLCVESPTLVAGSN